MEEFGRILVFGDVMLDKYVSGFVNRVSPEAPVPVVKVEKEWEVLGGAGNVASNIRALGGNPILVGMIGNDEDSHSIRELCLNQNVETFLLVGNQPTISKTRVIAGQQIVRLDREDNFVWEDSQVNQLNDFLDLNLDKVSVVLISDYGKGTVSDDALFAFFERCEALSIRVIVDPKRQDWSNYSGAFLLTPNTNELQQAVNKSLKDENEIVAAAAGLKHKFGIKNILVTQSERGMTLIGKDKVLIVPAMTQEVFDVSGAGDTVLATIGVMLSEGKMLTQAVFAANIAAGLVVNKRGTASVGRKELETKLSQVSKLIPNSSLATLREQYNNQRIVFTNGCFDILHEGHRVLLQSAHSLGDILVVGVNSDSSVARLKGETRPINRQEERALVLSLLPYVDFVIIFEEDTPLDLIKVLKPNTLVKGGDYDSKQVVGADLVPEVVIINLLQGHSTTFLSSMNTPNSYKS